MVYYIDLTNMMQEKKIKIKSLQDDDGKTVFHLGLDCYIDRNDIY